MANEKIEVSIVLDDGSIASGFANIEAKAKDSGKKVGDSFQSGATKGLDGFTGGKASAVMDVLTSKAALASAAIATIGFALKAAFDGALIGEKINALNSQFDSLAAREGLVGSKLKEGLELAADGLIDTEDLLQGANSAITVLGQSASRLPELLTTATQATALLGGTAKDRFEDLIRAVETGNQKLLQNNKIFVDVNKVYKDYADSLGISRDRLTKTQEQAALLDAVLENSKKTFKGVTNEVTPLANAMTRLKVASGEFFDGLSIASNKNFGGIFKSIADSFTGIVKGITPAQRGVSELNQEIEGLRKRLDSLAGQKANLFNLFTAGGNPDVIASINVRIKENLALIDELAKKEKGLEASRQEALARKKKEEEDLKIQKAAEAEARDLAVTSATIPNRSAELASKENTAAIEANGNPFAEDPVERAERKAEALKIINDQQNASLAAANKQFADSEQFSKEQRETVLTSITAAGAAKRIEIDRKAAAQSAAIERNKLTFAAGLLGQLATIQDSGSREAFEIGKAAALSQATINGYLAVTEAFKLGFPAALFAVPIAIATSAINIQKIAQTQYGQAGGSPASSVDPGAFTGGGIGATPTGGLVTDGNPLTTPTELIKPTTTIEVNIQGDVLDSDQTGLRIVDLLNSAFDKQGVQVRTA